MKELQMYRVQRDPGWEVLGEAEPGHTEHSPSDLVYTVGLG